MYMYVYLMYVRIYVYIVVIRIMHEGIRSACCNHYENKVLLSVSNMNLLIVGIQLVEIKHVQLYVVQTFTT